MDLVRAWCGVVLVLATAVPAASGELERDLEQRLRGAWVVVTGECFSDCAGVYNNNQVGAMGTTSKADLRFQPGELAKVDKINLKSDRLDLFLTLAQPVLASHMDGPFELFDEKRCKVQLLIDVPRSTVRSGGAAEVMALLEPVVEVYPSQAEARTSEHWNRRVRDPYPPDYERTLAQHAVWQADQTNAAVASRSDDAIDDANRVARDLRDDPDYLAGFAAGAEAMRSWWESSCSTLVGTNFSWVKKGTPRGHSGGSTSEKRWREGWSDGQELVFNLALADRLRGCYVQVPEPAPER